MDQGTFRLRAARWVIGLGRVYAGLLTLAAAWSLLGVVAAGSAAALLVPLLLAGPAAAWGALLRAFEAHRRRAWQLLVALAAAGAVLPVLGRPVTVLGAVSVLLHGLLLALLLHPDSRDWVAPGEPRRPAAVRPGGPPSGGHWGPGQPPQVPRAS